MLIGVVSLTGAVATWKAVNLGSQATDTDRRSVLETVIVQKNQSKVEAQLRSEQSYYARSRVNEAAADELDSAADQARSQGREADARSLEDQAQVFRELSRSLRDFFATQYVSGEGADARFDEARRQRDLLRQDLEASQVDPEQTVAEANRLHARSERFVRWIVVFVAVVVLLTIAQLSKVTVRPFLAAGASVVYVIATLFAFVGDKAR